MLSKKQVGQFQEMIWNFYAQFGRTFAWRNVKDPYRILVSEIMLQQTQTSRVVDKYDEFISAFGSFQELAQAELRDVLTAWQGLGYNRRGKYLYQIAQAVVADHKACLPNTPEQLHTLPGIGKATAASICAFAFNVPTVFIETNIRSVFIHTFFKAELESNPEVKIHDNQLLPLISQTLDRTNPREWYYALMDYGVMLKKAVPNPSRSSQHHAKQSKFEGSDRQIRGMILKLLTTHNQLTRQEICAQIDRTADRVLRILDGLMVEGLIRSEDVHFFI